MNSNFPRICAESSSAVFFLPGGVVAEADIKAVLLRSDEDVTVGCITR